MNIEAILTNPRLIVILAKIDSRLSDQVKEGRCPYCGGPLHQADYDRNPRSPLALGWKHKRRRSLCCGSTGCRRRTKPPSVIFLGSHVYLSILVILVTAMCHGVSARRARILTQEFEIDRSTLARWRRWWLEEFAETSFWKARRHRFFKQLRLGMKPLRALMAFFVEHPQGRGVIPLLKFMAPLTSSSAAV